MSQQFLYKLKSIRQRYGIEKTQQNPINLQQRPQSVQIIQRQHSIHKDQPPRQRQPSLLQFKSKKNQISYESQRSHHSVSKRQVNINLQDNFAQHQLSDILHKNSFDRAFRQTKYNQPPLKEKQLSKESVEYFSKTLGRTHSQQRKAQSLNNNYNLIYNYDENLDNILPTKRQFTSQTLQRQPLRSNNRVNNINIDNLKFNYDSLQKAQYNHFQAVQNTRPPTYSLAYQQSQSRPDWTIDKLCKVQQKIQAYLKR